MVDILPTSARWRDYLALTKPRVVLLMLLTALVGMFLSSPNMVDVGRLIFGLLGIGLVASSAAVMNHIADSKIDARMQRTQNRPIASGRLGAFQGIVFSAALGLTGMLVLYFLVNSLSVWLNFASWVGYGLVYTLFLKRATSHNIVIGGLFGSAPPLLGWVAITNSIEPTPVALLLIIFFWTPPHFWALALDRKKEYEIVNVPMLPVTHGVAFTKQQILIYTIVLAVFSLLPYFLGTSRWIYLNTAIVLNAIFLCLSILLLIKTDERLPKLVFKYSVIYLALLFVSLLIDHYVLSQV